MVLNKTTQIIAKMLETTDPAVLLHIQECVKAAGRKRALKLAQRARREYTTVDPLTNFFQLAEPFHFFKLAEDITRPQSAAQRAPGRHQRPRLGVELGPVEPSEHENLDRMMRRTKGII